MGRTKSEGFVGTSKYPVDVRRFNLLSYDHVIGFNQV